MQGGNFWSGALAGAFASISTDLLKNAYDNAGEWSFFRSDLAKSNGFALLTGAVSGGVGSVLGGGNFWMGAGQGLIVTAFNFLAHKIDSTHAMHKISGGSDGDSVSQNKTEKGTVIYSFDEGIWDTEISYNYEATFDNKGTLLNYEISDGTVTVYKIIDGVGAKAIIYDIDVQMFPKTSKITNFNNGSSASFTINTKLTRGYAAILTYDSRYNITFRHDMFMKNGNIMGNGGRAYTFVDRMGGGNKNRIKNYKRW